MPSLRDLRGTPALPILIGASLMLSLAMGLRQSFGLFMAPAVADLGMAVADYTLAIAVQNLAWGLLQPWSGALVARFGYRPVMLGGTLAYVLGLVVMATASSKYGIWLGAGVLIGLALACTTSSIAMGVAARPVPAALRSSIMGLVSAAGSLGALFSAPLGQALTAGWGWRAGVLGFVLVALAMIPAALVAGRVDRVPMPATRGEAGSAGDALRLAMRSPAYLVMAGAFFICGLQLVFLTTHLPSYLAICGMDPMLSAQALAVIGGFNVLGSLFFGWAGGRWSKPALLGGIYLCRSVALGLYFVMPPTPFGTLVFAAVMGFLWLGVAPLTAGIVVGLFGLRWQPMLSGIAFTSHQIGSFLGAYGGGLLFDALGSYDLAWKLGVGMGLVAGTVQLLAALPGRPGVGRPAVA
ncbi:MFS transporter [Siccirubricoccus phaeus]|uniref:MFS transporter n=1 Tax=Siccirubricoccus phaeus TaxID=2595053 RepID=UPI0011F11497|nr:MFS transporter [Siccirubricoccus phaeus]